MVWRARQRPPIESRRASHVLNRDRDRKWCATFFEADDRPVVAMRWRLGRRRHSTAAARTSTARGSIGRSAAARHRCPVARATRLPRPAATRCSARRTSSTSTRTRTRQVCWCERTTRAGPTVTPGARRNNGRSGASGRLAGSLCVSLGSAPSRAVVRSFFSEQAAAPEPLTPQMILFSLPPRPARGSWADGTRESRPCVSLRGNGRRLGVGMVVVSQVQRQVAAALLSSTATRRDARRATSAHAARAPRGRARHIDRARAVRHGRAAALRVPSRL